MPRDCLRATGGGAKASAIAKGKGAPRDDLTALAAAMSLALELGRCLGRCQKDGVAAGEGETARGSLCQSVEDASNKDLSTCGGNTGSTRTNDTEAAFAPWCCARMFVESGGTACEPVQPNSATGEDTTKGTILLVRRPPAICLGCWCSAMVLALVTGMCVTAVTSDLDTSMRGALHVELDAAGASLAEAAARRLTGPSFLLRRRREHTMIIVSNTNRNPAAELPATMPTANEGKPASGSGTDVELFSDRAEAPGEPVEVLERVSDKIDGSICKNDDEAWLVGDAAPTTDDAKLVFWLRDWEEDTVICPRVELVVPVCDMVVEGDADLAVELAVAVVASWLGVCDEDTVTVMLGVCVRV